MQQILKDARYEILALRRQNEVLSAQMGVVEVFAAALGLRRESGGAAPDVVQQIDRQIRIMDERGEK
jgi:hypothetical protein